MPPSELRNVSKPENTTYKSETYFQEIMKPPSGEIYVTHVTGWFVSPEEQLQGAREVEEAVEGKKYEGVVRFVLRCPSEPTGIVVLSIDHLHLMEFTMHVLPTEGRFVVFPSYKSGNYAFMFDYEGWVIAHPKFWDIRGLRPDGSFFDPTAPYYNKENPLAGKIPFNLDYAGMINPNYPFIASEVRKGRSGVTTTFNVGGTPRVMVYAPIFYNTKPYDRYGIFGGITIGMETTTFREPISLTKKAIADMVYRTKVERLVVILGVIIAATVCSFYLSKTITKPIFHLARKAREVAEGERPLDIEVSTGDELELLSKDFAEMALEIWEQRENLRKYCDELSRSKKSLEIYSYELEKKVNIIKNIHYLSHLLSIVYSKDEIFDAVLKTAVEGLGYAKVMLYLFDPISGSLTCYRSFNVNPDLEKIFNTLPVAEEKDRAIIKAFKLGETIFIKDVHEEKNSRF